MGIKALKDSCTTEEEDKIIILQRYLYFTFVVRIHAKNVRMSIKNTEIDV